LVEGIEQEIVFVLKDGRETVVPVTYGNPVRMHYKDLIVNKYNEI